MSAAETAAAYAFLGSLGSEVIGPTEVDTFHWADYLIFSLSLAISLLIGLYFAVTGDRQRTTEEFLLASRNAGEANALREPHLGSELNCHRHL